MYYLQTSAEDPTKGNLYQLKKGLRILHTQDFSFETCDNISIKGAIICQWMAEGKSLNVLEDYPTLPAKYEFFNWLKVDNALATLFEEAQRQRLLSLVEDLYQRINDNKEDLTEKAIEKHTDSLNKLTKYLKEFKAVPKSVVNTRVIVPPILEKYYDKNRKTP